MSIAPSRLKRCAAPLGGQRVTDAPAAGANVGGNK